MALINSRALKQDTNPISGDLIAVRDIIRRNDNGQMVVVVPAGQPVPPWVDALPEEVAGAKKAPPVQNKAAEGRPIPKAPKR